MNKETLSKIKEMFAIDCKSDAHQVLLLSYHGTRSNIFRTFVYDCFEKHLEETEYMFISIDDMLSQLTVSIDPIRVFKDCKTHMVRIGDNNSSDTDNSKITFEVIETANLKTFDLYTSGSLSIKYFPIGLFEKIFASPEYQNILTQKNHVYGFYFTFGKRLKATGSEVLEVMFTFQYEFNGTTGTAYFDYSED
jgi:hypothetical protein